MKSLRALEVKYNYLSGGVGTVETGILAEIGEEMVIPYNVGEEMIGT